MSIDSSGAGVVPLGIHDEDVPVGAHIAYFWETDRQFREAVGFLKVGLARGDFCVVFGHAEGNRRVCETLTSHGHDCARLEAEGRLAQLGGDQDADRMLSNIGNAFAHAVTRGATLIRLLGNIGWGHAGWPQESDILAFEAKVTGAAKQFPCVVVCMYDIASLSGTVMVHGALETHPLTFCRNVIRQNNHYVDIDDFLRRSSDEPGR